jgi:hypothetical protein
MMLYHATSVDKLLNIVKTGQLNKGSYWAANQNVHRYYMETVKDDGDAPVALTIDLSSLSPSFLIPDFNGIEEPLTYTLKTTEEQVWDEWANSTKDWQASLDIIGTVVYNDIILVDDLKINNMPAEKYVKTFLEHKTDIRTFMMIVEKLI